MKRVMVSTVAFSDVGLELVYMLVPEDVRSEGHLVLSRQLAVSFAAPEGLGAMAVDVQEAIEALVLACHEGHERGEVYREPPPTDPQLAFGLLDDDDEDDDVGMGDGR